MSDGQKRLPLQRLTLQGSNIKQEIIVEETAIQLNGLDERGELFTHALLATPIDLVELHAGHLVSEGYVEQIDSRDLFTVRNDVSIYVDFQGRVYSPRRERIVTSSVEHAIIRICQSRYQSKLQRILTFQILIFRRYVML